MNSSMVSIQMLTCSFAERRSLKGYKFLEVLDKPSPIMIPLEFQSYQALLGSLYIQLHAEAKIHERTQSKGFTGFEFSDILRDTMNGEFHGLFGSDINHEYGRAGIMQTFKLGTLGTSSYHLWRENS
jgi:hypothetical protein